MIRTVAVLSLVSSMGVAALGEDLAITSFPGNGTIIWAYPTNDVSSYRIEWASQAAGPYTNFMTAVAMLDAIAPTGATMAAEVPMFYRVVATVTNPPVPIGMVLIPAGTNAGTDPEFGAYSLDVASFYMDKYEVTKELWDEVYTWAITNGYGFDNAGSGKAVNHPLHSVNWYDCVKWCNARSQKESRPAVYTVNGAVYKFGQSNDVIQSAAAGYRLPTDTEWEYAARGGVASRRFSWSDSDEIQHARANYYSSSAYSYDTSPTRENHPTYAFGNYPFTSPVGSFAANGYGLHDMVGNVWEWCFTYSSNRLIRGGDWYSDAYSCKVARRAYVAPDLIYALTSIGFRVVLPIDQP